MASLSPELITQVGNFPVTNTILATIVVDIVLVLFIIAVRKRIRLIPGKFQSAVEFLVSYFYDLAKSMAGKRATAIFPWVMTFFIFIVVSNFLGLMPGIGSIGFYEASSIKANEHAPPGEEITDSHEEASTEEHSTSEEHLANDEHASNENHAEESHLITLLRPATSDFNATLALATISLVVTHALGIRFTGLKYYLSRYFVLNPIMLFVGMLELVSEFIKIFSLSFRLFGNIYAGEVVLATISGLFAFLAPLPFLLLESIVAIVQALVFAMLTLVFMSMLTEKHADH